MGLNVNLCKMLGLPETGECPQCGEDNSTDFDEYDIECGDPNPEPGEWKLRRYCAECEHEWTDEFSVSVGAGLKTEIAEIQRDFYRVKFEDQRARDIRKLAISAYGIGAFLSERDIARVAQAYDRLSNVIPPPPPKWVEAVEDQSGQENHLSKPTEEES